MFLHLFFVQHRFRLGESDNVVYFRMGQRGKTETKGTSKREENWEKDDQQCERKLAARCRSFLLSASRCDFVAKNIQHMTESHSQTHAQDGRGGEGRGERQAQRRSLGTGAQVHKRTKDGGKKRKGSGVWRSSGRILKGGRHCSWPHATARDASHRETLQNTRRTSVRKTRSFSRNRAYQASLKPLIGAVLRACRVRRQVAAAGEAA